MIRQYQRADAPMLKELFKRQGFAYDFPDVDDPSIVSKTIFDQYGVPKMAILARLTAEAYFLMDATYGSPQQKWQAFKALHEAARLDCYARGLDDISCWVPPGIEKAFGRKLLRLGWGRNEWSAFTRSVHEKTVDLKERVPALAGGS